MTDRRNATRVNYAAKATIFVANKKIMCWIADISARGALLMPLEKVPPPQYVRLNMSLPGLEEMLDIDAVVIREAASEGRYAIGVEFHCSNPRTETLIRTYVSWVLAEAQRAGQPAAPPPGVTPARPHPLIPAGPPAANARHAVPTRNSAAVRPARAPAAGSPTSRAPVPAAHADVDVDDEDELLAGHADGRVALRDLYRLAVDGMKEKEATPASVQSKIRSLLGLKK